MSPRAVSDFRTYSLHWVHFSYYFTHLTLKTTYHVGSITNQMHCIPCTNPHKEYMQYETLYTKKKHNLKHI